MKRFLLDNDGSNFIFNLSENAESDVAETVLECPVKVTTYLLCSGAGTHFWPTKVGRVNPRAGGLLAAHQRGIDPLGMLLNGLKAAGKETFITFRMNDVHDPTATDDWNTPRVRQQHPDCVVGLDEINSGNAKRTSYCLDYSRPEVSDYVLALIREQVALYGGALDGFQLDWMRMPRHLPGRPDEIWEKRGILTDFLTQARAIVRGTNRPMLLGCRVPTSLAGCRAVGLDITRWGALGLIDFLVVCPYLTTDWRIPIDEFREALRNRPVPIYAGFDFGFGDQTHFPESLRGACTSLYDCGADGIYIFNFPCWIEHLAARPYHWLSGLDRAETAAAKPLLFAIDHNRHRREGIDQPAPIPVTVEAGTSTVVTLVLPEPALPASRAILLIEGQNNVRLEVNGQAMRELAYGNGPGESRSSLFLEYARVGQARTSAAEFHNFRVEPRLLRPGPNLFKLSNAGSERIGIERINLGLW